MPFCTIEEAWGGTQESFSSNNNNNYESDKKETNSNVFEKNYSRTYKNNYNENNENIRFPEEEVIKIDGNKLYDKRYQDLINENKKLKKLLKKYSNNNNNNNNSKISNDENIFDLILFLSLGIFIIFLMDILIKVIKN